MTTTSDLAAVEALLLRVLPNPMGFAENVLGELAQRLGTDPAVGAPTVVPSFEADAHKALVDRNMLLAAALGACECWGEEDGCPVCTGLGRAGWMPPDPELYSQYVTPAVRRSSDGSPAEPAAGTRLAEAATGGLAEAARGGLAEAAPGGGEIR
jgi:hypothetical protein